MFDSGFIELIHISLMNDKRQQNNDIFNLRAMPINIRKVVERVLEVPAKQFVSACLCSPSLVTRTLSRSQAQFF
jgi:hypothetical protein